MKNLHNDLHVVCHAYYLVKNRAAFRALYTALVKKDPPGLGPILVLIPNLVLPSQLVASIELPNKRLHFNHLTSPFSIPCTK